MVKVSVIVPIYNTEAGLLFNCVYSILQQKYSPFLLILVNDGSTHKETVEALNSLKDNDNVIVLNKDNGGAPSARNYALNWDLNNYHSDLVCFVDADDYLSCDFLEKMVTAYNQSKCDIVISNYTRFYKTESFENNNFSDKKIDYSYSNTGEGIIKLANVQYPPIVMGKLFKSSLFLKTRFKEHLKFGDDTSFLYNIFASSKSNCYINYIGYHLNRIDSQESICRSKNLSNKQILSAIEVNIDIASLDLSFVKDEERGVVERILNNVSVDAYLELYPRFTKKIASKEELNTFADFLLFFKSKHRLKRYEVYGFKSRVKKTMFLYCRFLYSFFYRLFIRFGNRRYGVAIK